MRKDEYNVKSVEVINSHMYPDKMKAVKKSKHQ